MKGDVAQDFWAGAVAEPDIFKANHPSSSSLLTFGRDFASLC